MHESFSAPPRWGNKGRDRKALAILRTLEQHCGPSIVEGAWLDVGCGSGGIALTLASKARYVTGVDPEPWDAWGDAIASCSNLRLVTGAFDAQASSVSDASMDVVVCNQVYEHVRDPAALIRNIQRALVPGGVCYFAGPNLLWPVEPHVLWPFVHWLPRQRAQTLMRNLGSCQADALDAYSTHYWRLHEWFGSCGFVAEPAVGARITAELQVRGYERSGRLASKLPRSLLRLMMPLAPGFVFILRKPEQSANAAAD